MADKESIIRWFDSRPFTSCSDAGQVVHTRVAVTRRYNLVLVEWEECPVARKVDSLVDPAIIRDSFKRSLKTFLFSLLV